MSTTLEMARFTVDPAQVDRMLAARPAMFAAVREHCPGFLAARLLRLDERTFVDMVEWRSREEALAAAEAVMALPEAAAMFACIDEVVTMEHAEILEETTADARA